MHGGQKLRRAYAKHRAAQYGKRKDKRQKNKEKRVLFAFLFLALGAGILYGKKLPLLYLPESGYEKIVELATLENQTVREEEVFQIEYADDPELYLAVSTITGIIPEYVEPTPVVEHIDVREVLQDRFGELETLTFQHFLSNYYIEDVSTKATEELFNISKLLSIDLTMEKEEKPQILIFHTHGSEGYQDSRPGVTKDTVIGMGEILATVLREQYGYQVIHETTVFDRKANGADDRNNAYNNALPVITSILEQNPSIEVVIDLHRDSGEARTSVINGVKTAKVMLFNGLCRTKDGPISYYSNENLTGNLAFSLHMQITGNELYPGLMHRIYLKSYRYNMHLKEKYLLVELGTHKNTVAEAEAAMKPLAEVLATVLSGGLQ